MQVVFVNYGEFGNNSSNHIEGYAAGLAARGHKVGVVADGHFDSPSDHVIRVNFAELHADRGDIRMREMLADRNTILHGWTPRERVRRWIEPLADVGLRYVVHLEDDESIITLSQTKRLSAPRYPLNADSIREPPLNLSDPSRSRSFLNNARGVSIIVEGLRDQVPAGKPTLRLEPGAEPELFRPTLDPDSRRQRRAEIGVGPETTLLAFHGGVHPAIQRDMFSLFTAVTKLRLAGYNVALLRIGRSRDVTEVSTAFRRADGVIEVPSVAREQLPGWLDLADIYVQPGSLTAFNSRRLPSKLLDFFAMGRPVILPRANYGRECADSVEAVVLQQGGADEIARCVSRLVQEPERMHWIGRNGRKAIQARFDWNVSVASLEHFYKEL